MKNIIFNKTESFVGRYTSNHACQIFCSKSNCETMSGLTLEGDSGEEVALWLLTSLCTSAKREVEVAL